MKFNYIIFGIIILQSCNTIDEGLEVKTDLKNKKIELGKKLFFETQLSNPMGQSCASCHSPEAGFSDPAHVAISQGAVLGRFTNRNTPSLSYNVFTPSMFYNGVDETFIGGVFYDGRVINLQQQIQHPLFNPLEMNNTDVHSFVKKVKNLSYYNDFFAIFGTLNSDDEIFNSLIDALVSFEMSEIMNPFTSKFDYYNQGRATLSIEEKKGLALFVGKANCAACHTIEPDPITKKILFTDFSYDNIGVPKNINNPFYTMPLVYNSDGLNFIDKGLGKIKNSNNENGKFKVPSLRNVAISAPYFHNGSIKNLEEVIKFYNKRDIISFPPEVIENVNNEELGNLQLSDKESSNLIAFLHTLTDGYQK